VKKQWPYLFLAGVVILATLWWWGMFRSAELLQTTSQPHRYAYLEATGAYSKLADKQNEVAFELRKHGITPLGMFTLMLDDPRTTPHKALRARTGYLIDGESNPQPPLAVDTVPARPVLQASIKAHPLFAYGKVYGALLDHLAAQGKTLQLPTVERYEGSVLIVEMPTEAVP